VIRPAITASNLRFRVANRAPEDIDHLHTAPNDWLALPFDHHSLTRREFEDLVTAFSHKGVLDLFLLAELMPAVIVEDDNAVGHNPVEQHP